ncbi:hypothetical protein L0337_28705 [candidate division KSB1 bacterium]|nr:hypothetical protein [candidate division KSB1 bacterium]
MKHFISFIATVALLEGALAPSQAQFRWNPKPLPTCRTFPITEFGLNYRVSSQPVFEKITFRDGSITDHSAYRPDQQLYITSDLGFMRNLSPCYALGASNFVGFGDDSNLRGGLKLRMRRWFTNGTRLDVSPGILLWDSNWQFSRPGFTGNMDLKFKEWFALSLLVEYRRARGEVPPFDNYRYVTKTAHDIVIYIGMKAGSYAGLIGHGVAGVVAGVAGLMHLLFYESN